MNSELYMKERSAVHRVVWTSLALGAAMIALGVVLLLYPEKMSNLLGILIGVAALLYGLIRLVIYAVVDRRGSLLAGGFFAGIFFVVLGILALIRQDQVLERLTMVFGLLLLAASLLRIQHAIMMKRMGYSNWWLIMIFGFAALAFALLLVLNPSFIQNAYMMISGIFLIIDGAAGCATTIIFHIFLHGYKKEMKEAAAADAAYVELPAAPDEFPVDPPLTEYPAETDLPTEPAAHEAEHAGDSSYEVNPEGLGVNPFDPEGSSVSGQTGDISGYHFDPDTGEPLR